MIDPSLFKFLSNEAQDELRELEKTLTSKGWKLIESWLNVKFEQAKESVILAKTWPESRVAYGQMQMVNEVYRLPVEVEHQYTELAEQAREAAESTEIEDELDFE